MFKLSKLFSKSVPKKDEVNVTVKVIEEFPNGKCLCHQKNISGYCHEHRTTWI